MYNEAKKCSFVNADGKGCNAYHTKGSLFCFTHNPDKAQERAVAVSEGGRSRAFISNLAPIKIDRAGDIPAVAVRVLNEVRRGIIDPAVANTFFYGCNTLLKAYETAKKEHGPDGQEKKIYMYLVSHSESELFNNKVTDDQLSFGDINALVFLVRDREELIDKIRRGEVTLTEGNPREHGKK